MNVATLATIPSLPQRARESIAPVPGTRALARVFSALAVALGLLFSPVQLVYAQGQKSSDEAISAAVLNMEGDVEGELTSTLTSVLRNEAQQHEQYRVVNKIAINLSDTLLVVGCSERSPKCLQKAAGQLDATVLVFGEIDSRKEDYRVTVSFFDARKTRITNRLVRVIDRDEDIVVAFRKEIEAFFDALGSSPEDVAPTPADAARTASLQIDANISGASVRVDGRVLGRVPFSRKFAPGEHRVTVTHPGHESWSVVVELQEGSNLSLRANLDEASGDTAASESGGRATSGGGSTQTGRTPIDISDGQTPSEVKGSVNWPAWALVGVGGGALAGSAFSVIMMQSVENDLERRYNDGTLTPEERDELISTGRSYETTHRVLLVTGAGLALVGGVWLLVDALSTPGERVDGVGWRLGLSPTGVAASFRW